MQHKSKVCLQFFCFFFEVLDHPSTGCGWSISAKDKESPASLVGRFLLWFHSSKNYAKASMVLVC